MPRRPLPRVTRPPETASPLSSDTGIPALPVAELDAVLHERMRLAIAYALATRPAVTFGDLKRQLGMTDGNLSVHAKRLEEVGYISSRKTNLGRVSRTEYSLAPAGRRALHRYLDHLEAIVSALRPLASRS